MVLMQEIPDFSAHFENIRILANHFGVSKIHDVLSELFAEQVPFSQVWADMSVNGLPAKRNLTGIVTLILRNQGKDNRTALHLTSYITIEASPETKSADNFCKLIQYLFDWVRNYVDVENITDRFNEKFIIPDFLYSSSHFEATFPE
jgi:hypothetical protein